MKPKAMWHMYHNQIFTFTASPIEGRIAVIKDTKPADEQELRLRLLKPVQGELPSAVVKAGTVYNKTPVAHVYNEAWEEYDRLMHAIYKTRDAFEKALTDNLPAINALHAIECPDCPWNGNTIFPEGATK